MFPSTGSFQPFPLRIMMMAQRISFCVVAVLVLVGSSARSAERQTDDLGADLVNSLTSVGRFDDAEWVCREGIERSAAGRLSHCQWTARLCGVLAERNAIGLFQGKASDLLTRIDPAITDSCGPIDEALSRYPDALSKEFLAAAKLAIRQRLLRGAIVAASVSPPSVGLTDELLARVSRLQIDTRELQKTARAKWSASNGFSTASLPASESIAADQFDRLFQELAVERISLAILQTELFGPTSDDYRSAAAAAVAMAEEAILALPDSAPAKQTVRALLAESLLRSGDLSAAGETIARGIATPAATRSPIWTSLSVRYQLASGNESEAKRICREYYASQDTGVGSASEQSLEMAFAKLDVLLADSSDDAEVARWIEFIERSGGAFARRRAEAIAIRQLRSDGLLAGDSGKPRVSPSLIAAQGEDLLRRDDPGKAATFLREAALAEPSAEAAFAYAAKSAAASIAAADTEEAINVLRDTASRHASNAAAPNLMMQAALLASQPFQQADDPKKRLELLEEVLKEISQTWATSDVAAKANDWLCRILVQTDRPGEAAQAALELLTLGRRPDQLAAVSTLWFDYLSQLDRQEVSSNLSFLSAALNEIADESKSLADPIRQLSVWFFDRPLLSQRSADLIGDDEETEFLRKLARFRVSGQGMISEPESVGSLLRRRVRWRLERDAMLDASLQKSIGKVLSDWPGSNDWDKATARLWSDQDDAAIESIKRLAVLGDQRPRSLRRGMELLAQSQSIDARKAAVELADRLAAVMQIKSKEWYLVKLQAITWLNQIGQSDESRKRAKLVLLLHRPEETGLRERFEKYAAE